MNLLRDLLKDLTLASPHYPLFDDLLPSYKPLDMMDILTYCVDRLKTAKTQNGELIDTLSKELDWLLGKELGLVDLLNDQLYSAMYEVGLAKLLTIPELAHERQRKELPLTKENALRIELVQNVVHPPYGIRPTIDPTSVRAHWAQIPARLFWYGLFLDFVSALRQEQAVKVCRNCGKLYRPYKYQWHKDRQYYCSRKCKKRAGGKQRYQREIEQERTEGIKQPTNAPETPSKHPDTSQSK